MIDHLLTKHYPKPFPRSLPYHVQSQPHTALPLLPFSLATRWGIGGYVWPHPWVGHGVAVTSRMPDNPRWGTTFPATFALLPTQVLQEQNVAVDALTTHVHNTNTDWMEMIKPLEHVVQVLIDDATEFLIMRAAIEKC
nr:hypothetical protein Iba_chr05eCG5490 [Ipomoea batatas]